MFKLKPSNLFKGNESIKDLYATITNNDFNVNRYIALNYNVTTSYYFIDEKLDEEVFDFLLENGKLVKFSSTGKLVNIMKNNKGYRGGTFWFEYKDIFVKLSTAGQDDEISSQDVHGMPFTFSSSQDEKDRKDFKITRKNFDIMLCGRTTIQDFHFEDFERFIAKDEGSKVHLFIKDQYGDYSFQPINVNVPENIDLELNYGSKFTEIDKTIKERLNSSKGGLFMFHGPPGTGKTTYIKYLAGQINRDFIYIPTTMIENFTSDPNCLNILIQKTNCIIILEDAEKAIMKRHGDGMDSSAVSSLLNLSDGILSDILKTSVILTYNCPKSEIDSALRRKGRLQVDYEFTQLNVKDSKRLAKHLKHSKKTIDEIDNPMSVADIYNLEKEVDLNDEKKEEKNERVIGFGKA